MLGTIELDCICILYDVPFDSKNKTFVEFAGPFCPTKPFLGKFKDHQMFQLCSPSLSSQWLEL